MFARGGRKTFEVTGGCLRQGVRAHPFSCHLHRGDTNIRARTGLCIHAHIFPSVPRDITG